MAGVTSDCARKAGEDMMYEGHDFPRYKNWSLLKEVVLALSWQRKYSPSELVELIRLLWDLIESQSDKHSPFIWQLVIAQCHLHSFSGVELKKYIDGLTSQLNSFYSEIGIPGIPQKTPTQNIQSHSSPACLSANKTTPKAQILLSDQGQVNREMKELINTLRQGVLGPENFDSNTKKALREFSLKGDPDYVICLICGKPFSRITKRHLGRHGLTVEEYKATWDMPTDTALCCEKYRNCMKTVNRKPLSPDTTHSQTKMADEEIRSAGLGSIHKDYVSCLECGQKFKQISNHHLKKAHHMSLNDYRLKWRFPKDTVLMSHSLREKRRQILAKARQIKKL